MNDKIIVCILAVSLLHEVQICNACLSENATKVIAMCTAGSAIGSSILLTTSNASVNTCVCTIEANLGLALIINTGQPNSPDCGTRIDITDNSGIISKTFQCQQLQLYQTVGVSIVSGDITFHKQSNSTEDDLRYCLLFTGPPITISCYGTDLPHPTTTTKETTSTTTVRSPTTTSTTAVPTATGIIATPAITTTQKPPSKSLPTSSSSTSKHTMLLTLSTTNHQGDNADVNVAVIIGPTLGGLCVTGVVIVVIFLCRSYFKNANKTQTEDERNDSYANLSNDREGNSYYETLNNMQIICVSVVTPMYENVACINLKNGGIFQKHSISEQL